MKARDKQGTVQGPVLSKFLQTVTASQRPVLSWYYDFKNDTGER